jgi:transposase
MHSKINNPIFSYGGHLYGQTTGKRTIMETYQTDFAQTPASTQRRQAACRRPQNPGWNYLCTQDRYSLAVLAKGNGLRQRYDLLATSERMAKGRDMGQTAPHSAQPSARERQIRFFSRGGRFGFSTGCFWGAKTGPNATDRRKLGSKHHIITDANGIPFAAKVTGANRHDVTQLLPLVESIPPIAGKAGHPRKRPDCVQGDRAYDSQPHRNALCKLGIDSVLAKRRTENGSGLGAFRWVVERTLPWLHQFRRLRVRYERRDDIHEAFLTIGCILICSNFI